MINGVAKKQTQQGFTIVELLIVVVVIAILAAITIVAYNGIQQRSRQSALQSNIGQIAKKIESLKLTSGTETYPASLSAAGLTATSGITYAVSTSGKVFCVSGVDGNIAYYVASFQIQPTQGSCGVVDGLVSWWRLNSNTSDENGGTNSATANGQLSVTGQNGQSSGAYAFNTSATAMSSNSTGMPTGSAARTVTAWVNPSAYPAASSWFMAHAYGGASATAASALSINPSGRVSFNGQSSDFISALVVPLNTWSFIGYTISGTQAAIILNNTVNNGVISSALNTTASTNSYIGAYLNGTNRWVGSIDDVRVYDRALSAAELRAAYAAGSL